MTTDNYEEKITTILLNVENPNKEPLLKGLKTVFENYPDKEVLNEKSTFAEIIIHMINDELERILQEKKQNV